MNVTPPKRRLITCARCSRERPHDARGMCHTCIEYLRRNGQLAPLERWAFDPAAAGGPYTFGDARLPASFWNKVELDDDTGCWRWTGSLYQGYGNLNVKGLPSRAHRATYIALVGPIENNLSLDHLCHTNDLSCTGGTLCPHRACCFPGHLEPLDLLFNVARGRGGKNRTHCPQDHEYTKGNTIVDARGSRHCRTCVYAHNNRRKAQLRAQAQSAQNRTDSRMNGFGRLPG